MPIKIKTDIEFGDTFYLKDDPEQLEHSLISIMVLPGNAFKFRLSHQGVKCWVHDFEASKQRDDVKYFKSQSGDQE